MRSLNRVVLLTVSVVLMLSLTGCFNMSIKHNVKYPAKKFEKTRKMIHKLAAKNKGRKFSEINVLVYEEDGGELISFSVSRWLAKKALKEGCDFDKCKSGELMDSIKINDTDFLDNLGPGLLVEVEDIEEGNHVLIWLE